MLAMGTSGSMSGDGKRGASRATALILDSTNRAGLCFQRIPVAGVEFGLNAVVALADLLIFLALWVKLRHLMRERFHLFFNSLQARKYGEALLQNCAPGK